MIEVRIVCSRRNLHFFLLILFNKNQGFLAKIQNQIIYLKKKDSKLLKRIFCYLTKGK